MKRRLFAIYFVCVGALIGTVLINVEKQSLADERPGEPSQPGRDRWMTVKLSAAQQILEHLTSGEFNQLETSARRMQVMNFLEQWQRDEDFEKKSDYQGQLNAFEFATKELIRTAEDGDVDGALQAYVAMTQSCVRCHKLIRDAAGP